MVVVEGRNNMKRVVNVRGGREAGRVAFICLHCANCRKEDSSLLVFTPPLLFVTFPALCYILLFSLSSVLFTFLIERNVQLEAYLQCCITCVCE